MEKFKLINGWTKARVLEQIKLKNNGTRATAGDGRYSSCLYRTTDGANACFVGAFLPDDHDAVVCNFMGGAGALLNTYPALASSLPFSLTGCSALQWVHDRFRGDGYDPLDYDPLDVDAPYKNKMYEMRPKSLHEAAQVFLDLCCEEA